ncbi:hypothetical protein L1987_45171 [Smallanthus sonchifolius]|uniref:Uncharacterized protein n=1 Tax=Smallanthus sonchifolius TaxID=185202 RepID=A0ACB9GRA6_9ASTR|nr:hypothetical protein L1987_45171 [Smallanthus sonchifolius]
MMKIESRLFSSGGWPSRLQPLDYLNSRSDGDQGFKSSQNLLFIFLYFPHCQRNQGLWMSFQDFNLEYNRSKLLDLVCDFIG